MYKITKNGFTLLELLGVILLLGIIATMVILLSNRMLGKSKESLYQTQIETITDAAKKWTIPNNGVLPMDQNDEAYNLPLSKLSEDGYIDSDELIDPRDNKKMCGYIEIKYNNSKNQYSYKFIKEACKN